jgi:hypothetical protein
MQAFATAEEFGKLIKREFTTEESEWIDELLAAASAHLRSVIGQLVFPRTTSEYTAYPSGGREDLPQWPIVTVTAVKRDGHDVPFTYRPGYITVRGDEPCDVTFTWGYDEAPDELKRLACVLVSQTLLTLEAQLGLTAGGLSSVQLDDFRLAWANAGDGSGMSLTEHAEKAIQQQFGQGGVTVVETRG